MMTYCNNNPFPIPFNKTTVSLPMVGSQYGDINLYCEWNFNSINKSQYVYVEFNGFSDNIFFNIEGQYTDGTPFYFDMINSKFAFNDENILYVNLHYFSLIPLYSPPFIVNLDYKKVTKTDYARVFISIVIIVVLVGLIILSAYRCYYVMKQRREMTYQANFPNRELNYIVANNPGIVVNIDHHVQAETILKNKNKLIIEKLLETELKPVIYEENLNEYNASCTICMEGFIVGKQDVTVLSCKHIFHHNCLKNWLFKNLTHPKCPNCNNNVAENSENSNQPHKSILHDNTQNNLNVQNDFIRNINNQQSFTRMSNDNNNRYIPVSRSNVNIPVENVTNSQIN